MSGRVMNRRARVGVLLGLGLVWSSGAGAAGLLEKEHPLVQRGRQAYDAGRYEDALTAFEEAKKERPHDPTVEYNRGDALMKLGRLDEAKKVFQGVADANSPPALREKATYNLGNVHAMMGDTREAMKAYRRALTLDPSDEQARHNYEVLLRNLPPPQKGQDGGTDGGQDGGTDGGQDAGRPDAGQPDGGSPKDGGTDGGADGGDAGADAGSDGGEDGGQGDGGQGDGGQNDGGGEGGQDAGGDAGENPGGDAGQGDGGQGDGGQGEEEGQGADAGSEGEMDEVDAGINPENLDRQDAERLLDAMKQNEKNLQLWRFQQKKRQRNPNEKDW